MLINRWSIRQRFYKECKYTIQHHNKPNKKDKNDSDTSEEFMFKF